MTWTPGISFCNRGSSRYYKGHCYNLEQFELSLSLYLATYASVNFQSSFDLQKISYKHQLLEDHKNSGHVNLLEDQKTKKWPHDHGRGPNYIIYKAPQRSQEDKPPIPNLIR